MGDDSFWSVKDRETAEEKAIREMIAGLEAQLEVCRRAEMVKHAPGFQELLKSIQKLHEKARGDLVGNEKLTNEGLREMRGRVRGLESVLALLTSSSEPKLLADRLAECKNALAEALRRRPQPKEVQT